MHRCLIVAPLLAALVCSACTDAPQPANSQGADTPIAFNLSEDPHSLDPVLAQTDDERQVARLMFDVLLDVDDRGNLIPSLATAVPSVANGGISADGRTITYHLRRGVRWQDGALFTSRDVRYTWRAIVDPRNDVPSTHGYDLIAAVDTPDALTAVLHLRHAWAPAVATYFTYGTTPMEILPAHLLEGRGPLQDSSFNAHPVGTGPFKLTSWVRGEGLTFTPNRDYFRGVPSSRGLWAREIPDTDTDLVMLRGGQLDWSLLSPAQRLALGTSTTLRITYARFAGFGAIAFNCRRAPFDDVRMRRAVALSIDRARMSAGITRGQYPVIDSDQPAYSWAYDATVALPRYDPAAADRALDALGWKRGPDGMRRDRSGRSLALVFATFPESDTAVRTAEYAQQMLRDRGIAVEVKKISLAQFYLPKPEGGVLLSGAFDLAYFAWRTGEDPDDSSLVTCSGVANYAGYCSAQAGALETRALTTTIRTQRRALYSRIQRILAADIPYVFLYSPRYSYAVQPSLRGLRPSPFSPMWNAWQWAKR